MKKSFLGFLDSSDKLWFILSTLLSVGFLLIIFSDFWSSSMGSMYFNSDMLYDPVIFKDVFIDKSGFKGWHLNAAPNFFPDMFIYSIINAISGNFISANFFFSISQYLIILLLIYWIFRQTNKEKSWKYSTLFNYLMFLFLLIPIFTIRSRLTFQLISISYHMGSFIMFLLSLNILILYLKEQKNRQLIYLFLAVLVGSFNDRLYISQFVLSVFPLVFLLYNKEIRSRFLKPIIVITAATASGLYLFKFLGSFGAIEIIDTGFKMFNFENLSVSWTTFWKYIASLFSQHAFERSIFIICLLSIILSILFIVKNRKNILNPGKEGNFQFDKYIVLIILIYLPITLLTPVLNGAFISPSIIRFNVMAFYMGMMLLPMILMVWPKLESASTKILRYLLPLTSIAFIILFGIKIFTSDFRKGLNDYFNFYPEKAAILDDLKDEHQLKYGIGNYWFAKYATMFSKKDMRLYTVYGHTLRPFYHSTNENWYHSGGKGKYKDPVFNYTVRKIDADSEKLRQVFGENLDTLYLDVTSNYIVIKLPEFEIDRESREIRLLNLEDTRK